MWLLPLACSLWIDTLIVSRTNTYINASIHADVINSSLWDFSSSGSKWLRGAFSGIHADVINSRVFGTFQAVDRSGFSSLWIGT